jgi:hypothetical protein
MWPLAARAQRPSIPVIGFLDATTAADTVYRVSAFRDGLKEAGFIEGHNVAIEFRWAENKFDRMLALAAELVQRKAAVFIGRSIHRDGVQKKHAGIATRAPTRCRRRVPPRAVPARSPNPCRAARSAPSGCPALPARQRHPCPQAR